MQYAFLLHTMLTLGTVDYGTTQRNVCVRGKELGLLFYPSTLSASLSFTFLKIFLLHSPRFILFYTQYIVSSPHFIPSPCFIPSPQSTFYTNCFPCGLLLAKIFLKGWLYCQKTALHVDLICQMQVKAEHKQVCTFDRQI